MHEERRRFLLDRLAVQSNGLQRRLEMAQAGKKMPESMWKERYLERGREEV